MQPSLTATNEHYRLLVESVRDYAIFMLDPQGRVATWNEGAHRIKGYAADEIIGHHFSEFYRPDDVKNGLCERELEIAQREGRCEDFGWRVRKDGTQFWANVVITALRDKGVLVGYAKVTRDMTDRAYRTFIEATHAIVWTTAANGVPNADSSTYRAFTGQSEADFRADPFAPVHPDDRVKLDAAWVEARARTNPLDVELRLRRHDGMYVWFHTRAVALRDAGGNVREWFGTSLDISVRKAAEAGREAALADAERAHAELATTLSSIGDAVIVTDTHGHVTFMNAIAEKLTRWSSANARGRPLLEVFPIVNEDTRRPLQNPVEKVLREGAIVGLANHTVLVRRDGTDVPIGDSAAPIRDASGVLFGVVMVFRDVSAEKREANRRAFLLHAGEALMASSDYRDSLSLIARLAVPKLADWCTVALVEPGATTPTQIAVAHVDPAKVAIARDLARKFPHDPNAANGVARVLRTGQSEIHRQLDPDVIERSATNDEHRAILHELGLHSAMVVPLRGRDRTFGTITFAFAESGREYTDDELAFAEGFARRAAVVIERRKLEEERAQLLERERVAREQADIANRAKDEFLATVSHELRNPLSAILGWAKLLANEVPEKFKEPVNANERNARSQARLVDDMLDVSRIISGKLRLQITRIDLAQIITDGIEAQHRAADAKNVRIDKSVAPNIEVQADQVRLQQIVTNLVGNAVKFTPRGGHVAVDATCDGDTLEIRVSDTGEGIEPSRLTAIFEPFRQEDATTTRRHGGLGLGLAIVRELVNAHDGTVRAESQGKGRGATFVVTLPARCTSGTRAPSSSPPRQRPLPSLDGIRVLVVDDERDMVEMMAALLRGAGAQLLSAGTADEAIDVVKNERPDVIVSDIGMPQVDGYELMRRIRGLPASAGGRTPGIALTAYARQDDVRHAFEAGFQRHLAKPLDPAEIVLAVANLAGLPV